MKFGAISKVPIQLCTWPRSNPWLMVSKVPRVPIKGRQNYCQHQSPNKGHPLESPVQASYYVIINLR